MADLEAVLADVSYLMAMEMSKQTPESSKKIILPDPSVRSAMHKYLERENEVTFDKIFNQKIGFQLFKDYCENYRDEPVPQLKFYEEIRNYEKDGVSRRTEKARKINLRQLHNEGDVESYTRILQRVRGSCQQFFTEERSPNESLRTVHRRDFQSFAWRSLQVLHGELTLYKIPSVEKSRA